MAVSLPLWPLVMRSPFLLDFFCFCFRGGVCVCFSHKKLCLCDGECLCSCDIVCGDNFYIVSSLGSY